MKLKKTKTKQFYFRIQDSDLGDDVDFIPIRNYQTNKRAEDEPDVKRICVAPTPAQCLTAIGYHKNQKCVLYVTKNPIFAYQPFGVFDQKTTNEKWLTRKIKFKKVCEFEIPASFPKAVAHIGSPELSKIHLKIVKMLLKDENIFLQS
jgi:hypothetical protein